MANVKKGKEDKRDIQISLWVSKKEKEKLKEMADKDGRSLNNFILHKAMESAKEE